VHGRDEDWCSGRTRNETLGQRRRQSFPLKI
jgi:hypothetical protein